MTIQEILSERKGVCKQFVKLFGEMCSLGNVRVKSLKGFAKGPEYQPGKTYFLLHETDMNYEVKGQ